jgi:AcrR family transcriptional regulator
MPPERGISATMTPVAKTPRTERGRKTLRLLLDAAAAEFGEKGFHESSVVSITQRAGVALGSFYTYFDSKDSLFRALVKDMSAQVRNTVGPVIAAETDRLSGERRGLAEFLSFVRKHKELYRIIDESEFVDPPSYRAHYENTVAGYVASLHDAAAKGQVRADVEEVHAWAIVGMNVFLGLRYGVMGEDRDVQQVADIASDLLTNGLKR